MSFPKISEARSLSDEELAEQILALKRELFQLRLQQATRQEVKPHQFKHARHRLAQLLTVERERELVAQPATGRRRRFAKPAAPAQAATSLNSEAVEE